MSSEEPVLKKRTETERRMSDIELTAESFTPTKTRDGTDHPRSWQGPNGMMITRGMDDDSPFTLWLPTGYRASPLMRAACSATTMDGLLETARQHAERHQDTSD